MKLQRTSTIDIQAGTRSLTPKTVQTRSLTPSHQNKSNWDRNDLFLRGKIEGIPR